MSSANTWFQTRKLDAQTWVINDNGHSLIYLVTGTRRALLIDTGWGVGDLPGLVASLTPLPLTVLNTHGHPDHVFGNGAFERVYITEADLFMAQGPISEETRQWIKDSMLAKNVPVGISLDDWHPSAAPAFGMVHDGDIFDLGGRTLRVVTTPGHSRGSICLLDLPVRRLFTGDLVLPGVVWAHLDESTTLSEYHSTLERLQGLRIEFDALLPAHGNGNAVPFPTALLNELTDGMAQILSGKLIGQPEHTFAGDGLRCVFGVTGVVYRPDRL
jgi:glyoxylase-like metal-dependent hydrolase (beta-lactamase superfamily II)